MLTDRQTSILTTIIQEYIRQAKPISSGMLVDHDEFDVSPATLRNEMMELEEAGYLEQPHTSSGRIPTERSWKWYVQHYLPKDPPSSAKNTHHLGQVIRGHKHSQNELMRQLAKTMAELSQGTVIVAFSKRDTFYTGLSNLFQQPEFEEVDLMQALSRVVDHLDEVMDEIFDHVTSQVQVLVGKDNPFSPDCGSIVARYSMPRQHSGVISILGPLRQDYQEHVALIQSVQHLLRTA